MKLHRGDIVLFKSSDSDFLIGLIREGNTGVSLPTGTDYHQVTWLGTSDLFSEFIHRTQDCTDYYMHLLGNLSQLGITYKELVESMKL